MRPGDVNEISCDWCGRRTWSREDEEKKQFGERLRSEGWLIEPTPRQVIDTMIACGHKLSLAWDWLLFCPSCSKLDKPYLFHGVPSDGDVFDIRHTGQQIIPAITPSTK
jgi:hypothetical protein